MRWHLLRTLVSGLGLMGSAHAQAEDPLAPDFSIPGRIEQFKDWVADAVALPPIGRPAGQTEYLVTYDSGARVSCVHADSGERVPVWPFDTPERMNHPVFSADGPTVYADQRDFSSSSFNREGFWIFAFRCADQLPPDDRQTIARVVPERFSVAYDPEFTAVQPFGPLLAWEDRVCVVTGEAIGCAERAATEPTLRRVVTPLEVVRRIDHGLRFDDPDEWRDGSGPRAPTRWSREGFDFPDGSMLETLPWRFEHALALPGGRMLVLLRTAPDMSAPVAAAYLVVLDAQGGLERVRYGFDPTAEVWSGLRGLAYHPEWDAAVVWPLSGWDWTVQRTVESDGAGNSATRMGFSGVGLLLLPLGQPGVGYLPLSAAIVDTDFVRDGGAGAGLAVQNRLPSLNAFYLLGASLAAVQIGRPGGWPFLRWDPTALDLDQDGLTAAEEAARGTSDWRWDSDADGLADGAERGLGFDPNADEGLLADRAFDGGGAGISQSSWLRDWRLPALQMPFRGARRVAPNPGVAGPLCVDQTCHFLDGRALAIPHPVETLSLDGRLAVSPDGGLRTDLTTGATEVWLDPPLAGPPSERRLYVEDAEHALVVQIDRGTVAAYTGNRPPQVVFDLARYRDPRPGSEYPLAHRGPLRLHPMGYHQESRQVLLGVVGGWDAWVVAVSAAGPRILERAQGMARRNRHQGGGEIPPNPSSDLPHPLFLQPNGVGDTVSDRWIFGPALEDGRQGAGVDIIGNDQALGQAPVGAFGEDGEAEPVLVVPTTGEELVTIPRRVEPGDALVYASLQTAAPSLFRVGPRGGLVSLWTAPRLAFTPRGMAISPAGRACFVGHDDGACLDGCFVELEPVEDDRIPLALSAEATGHRFLDCAYLDEDTIHVLVAVDPDPVSGGPQVQVLSWRRDRPGFSPMGEPVADGGLQGFTDTPNGPELRPFDFAEASAAEVWLDDGRRYRWSRAAADPRRAQVQAQLGLPATPEVQDAVARADGVVLLRSTDGLLVAWNPEVDRYAGLFDNALSTVPGQGIHAWALARVPGGVGRDPWTGRPLTDVPTPAAGAAGALAPLGPAATAPRGGTPLPVEAVGGCDQTPSAPVPTPFVFLALGWAATRRRKNLPKQGQGSVGRLG